VAWICPPRRGIRVNEVTGQVQAPPRFTEAEVSAALGGPVSRLGSGSYGDTWRHGDTAVKIICDGSYPPERLKREVDGLSRVSSPHVVRLLDTRTVTLRGQPRPALVFEYIAGDDIGKRIAAGRLPSSADGVAFLRGLLTGVGHMHEAQTVHRDIKPGNIALRDDDWSRPVLLDLGLARGVGEATITVYPQQVGTFFYMAPEQLEGRPARKAADLFAVGVTAREVLSGRHPFYDPGIPYTAAEMIARIAKGAYPLSADVPAHVAELLDRLTAERTGDRGSARSSLRRLGAEGAAT
jgi:serine/threonine-protein kinase